jgi:hypothetical protein
MLRVLLFVVAWLVGSFVLGMVIGRFMARRTRCRWDLEAIEARFERERREADREDQGRYDALFNARSPRRGGLADLQPNARTLTTEPWPEDFDPRRI